DVKKRAGEIADVEKKIEDILDGIRWDIWDKTDEAAPGGKWGMKLSSFGHDVLKARFGQPLPNNGPVLGKIYPGTKYRTHAHHIVMRNGPAGAAAALDESKKILAGFGLKDPDNSSWNLVWAPNRGHTVDYAINVLNALKKAKNAEEAKAALRDQAAQ